MASWTRVAVLSRGSHGTVFLAVPSNGPLHFVAVKVALMEKSTSLRMEEKVLQHFIGCPEIVQCIGSEISFEGDTFDSIFYNLVLEYAAGGTLADLITQRKRLPENEVKEYLRMILRGLSCIHGKGFVHADLKPANILAFPQNGGKMKLKIADFGLSKRCANSDEVVERCNFEPSFRGTPKYMSPESVVFGKIDAPLDIWSLGCILVEMMSGKQVWDSCVNHNQLLKKLVHEMEIPNVPEELSRQGRDFLASCFDHNTKRRWTADMLLQHPYLNLQEQQKLDDKPIVWSLPNPLEIVSEELDKEGMDFRCSELDIGQNWTTNMLPKNLLS